MILESPTALEMEALEHGIGLSTNTESACVYLQRTYMQAGVKLVGCRECQEASVPGGPGYESHVTMGAWTG